MKYQPRTAFVPGPIAAGLVVAACLAGPASAETSQEAIRWLDRLERTGRQIETFAADVTYEKTNRLLGDHQIRIGRILYAAPNPGNNRPARFAIRFTKRIVNQQMRPHRVDYIFDGRWLAEVQHQRNLFIRRQVVAEGEQFDPLSIDGPFPVPIGQTREQVLRRFRVEVRSTGDRSMPVETDQPPVHLRMKPRPDAPDVHGRKRFKRVDLWFGRDGERLLPLMVRTINAERVETLVKLTGHKVNHLDPAQLAERFDTQPPEEGDWRVETSPLQSGG